MSIIIDIDGAFFFACQYKISLSALTNDVASACVFYVIKEFDAIFAVSAVDKLYLQLTAAVRHSIDLLSKLSQICIRILLLSLHRLAVDVHFHLIAVRTGKSVVGDHKACLAVFYHKI